MTPEEMLAQNLCAIAARVRDGTVRSRDLTAAVLEALERQGSRLGAVARLWPERAMAEAEACDRERARGRLRGPLHGVPLAHKDMFYRKGELTECGSRLFRGFRPTVTATVLERLDAAGAIDVGRTHMVEVALGITGHNPWTGTPKNPWNTERLTGGSTSGGAASVAARLNFATLGSDTGGSIRVPSAFCNLVGIKPTYGRVSRAGCMPLSFTLDHIGPICRSSADCALMLGVIAGTDPRDPTTGAVPVPDYAAALGEDLRGQRILALVDGLGYAPEPAVARHFEEACAILRGLGAELREGTLPGGEELAAVRRVVGMVEPAAYHREHVLRRRAEFNPHTLARMEPGFAIEASIYARALAARAGWLERICRELLSEADLLVLPSAVTPPPPIAETDTGGDARFVDLANRLTAYVAPFNYLGLPAASVPMGFDEEGLPMGLQIVGRPFAEARVLRACFAFEQATGHTRRRPPSPAPDPA